jgi:glycosyltransferase involved in cell wall biosynthesis
MRLIFFGDNSSTGFGTVTLDLGRRLVELGEDVRFVSQNPTSDDLPEPFRSRTYDILSLDRATNEVTGQSGVSEGSPLIPSLLDGTFAGTLHNGEPAGDWAPEVAILLGDYRAVQMMIDRAPEAFEGLPCYHYIPVEGVNLPPSWGKLWRVCTPVAMSNFGADEIAIVTGERPPMVYHGVDTEVFHPVTSKTPVSIKPTDHPELTLSSKNDCKLLWARFFDLPTPKKWVLRTDRHMPRKRYNSFLRSMAPVLQRQPDTLLVIHCQPMDFGGYLPDSISKIPGAQLLNPSDETRPEGYGLFGRPYPQIILTNLVGIERDALVSLYNAADVYASPSAEGFGLTLAESIACGVPAVGIRYSAVPEVIGQAGITVEISHLVENEYDHFWAAVDEQAFGRAVEFLLTHQTRREDMGRKGPVHVRANFDWDNAAREFVSLIHSSAPVEVAA